jgi:hypothetical protein
MDIYWRALSWTGLEHLSIQADENGVVADSLVLADMFEQPIRLAYRIRCSADWVFQSLQAELLCTDWSLRLTRDPATGHWSGAESLEGCLDVDIMATPFTNTLPIRRLELAPGESRRLKVAYVRLPELTVTAAEQTYTCLEKTDRLSRYRYQSGSFQADLEVDPQGLVLEYPNYWRRD